MSDEPLEPRPVAADWFWAAVNQIVEDCAWDRLRLADALSGLVVEIEDGADVE